MLVIDELVHQNFMFLVGWPEELGFVNDYLPFPLNTLTLILGAFALFNVFYAIFVKPLHRRPAADTQAFEPVATEPADTRR